jgi:hypothetical protein
MSAETVRKIHRACFWYWAVPGFVVSVYFRGSVTYLVAISVYTIVVEHFLGWKSKK